VSDIDSPFALNPNSSTSHASELHLIGFIFAWIGRFRFGRLNCNWRGYRNGQIMGFVVVRMLKLAGLRGLKGFRSLAAMKAVNPKPTSDAGGSSAANLKITAGFDFVFALISSGKAVLWVTMI
jgi:hypothetical protein